MQATLETLPITDTPETTGHIFLTAMEVSKLFFNGKIPYSKVLKMTRNGELPALKQGKSYIYLRSALEKWVEKTFNKPTWANKSSSKRL